MAMIKNAPDQDLIDLADHLGFKFGPGDAPASLPATSEEPSFWRPGMLRLFITHLARHRIYAAALQDELLQYGISSFVAHNDIEPSAAWMDEIELALKTCDALVALMHKNFHASPWTDQEMGFAMGHGVPVSIIRLGEEPYGFIGRFQAFNGNDKDAVELAKELSDCYRKHKATRSKMGSITLSLFERFGSWASAKERIGYLEKLKYWEPDYAERIVQAAEEAIPRSPIRSGFR